MLGQLWRSILAVVVIVLAAAGCSGSSSQAADVLVVADVSPSEATPLPTALPTTAPVTLPTATAIATAVPTTAPTSLPTPVPTAVPAPQPTAVPAPTALPTAEPTAVPAPTAVPVPDPTPQSTAVPAPTTAPEPTPEPTAEPTGASAAAAAGTETDTPGSGGPPAEHVVSDVGYITLGQAGQVAIALPAARIELIGFHEAGHPGSQGFNAAGNGVATMVLDSRGRGTDAQSAADIVIPPGEPVRSPVTGTVIAANSYVLYCEHQDRLVYIEPDGLPGWQVRIFHVNGPLPAVGDRVVAGETVIASGANLLPFESQVDEFTAEPSWAHVHIEVVDTSVPDTRPAGPGCPEPSE